MENTITFDVEAKSMRMIAKTNEVKVVRSETPGRAGQHKLVLEFDNGERVLVVVGTDLEEKAERKSWLSVHSLLSVNMMCADCRGTIMKEYGHPTSYETEMCKKCNGK